MRLMLGLELKADGYGMPALEFEMPDPPLMFGWSIVRRSRSEDGEHIWVIATPDGQTFRWLEDEGGPEWVARKTLNVVDPT